MAPTKLLLALALTASLVGLAVSEAHLFTSIDNLINVFDVYHEITTVLERYAEFNEEGNQVFDQFMSNYRKVGMIKDGERKAFLGNPVNAFILIRMLTVDLNEKIPKISSQRDQESGEKIFELLLEDINTEFKGQQPTFNDYYGALMAINRLINAYRYRLEDVRLGKFNEKSRSIFPLDAFDCLALGAIALKNNEFHLTYAWANQSLQLLDKAPSPYVGRKDIYLLLSEMALKQNNTYHGYLYREKIKLENPDSQKEAEDLDKFVKELAEKNQTIEEGKERPLITKRPLEDIPLKKIQYENLCREKKSALLPVKPLGCRYVKDHPFLVIGPVKEEKIYDDPPMWIYYDTLTEKQAAYLKKIGLPKLSRAKVGGGHITDIRITQTYFFQQEHHTDKTLKYLDYFVGAITKLGMADSEPWQIANYGIGGQYEPHTDHAVISNDDKHPRNERFATWLNYIEAPELGGDTVFVNLRIKTKAVARSSVLWYNLGNDMHGDDRTLHAACPVVLGSKWVNNKWIHQYDQILRKPCPLSA